MNACLASFEKGKPSETVGRKTTGLTFFKEIKPAGLPEGLGLAVIGKKVADGPA